MSQESAEVLSSECVSHAFPHQGKVLLVLSKFCKTVLGTLLSSIASQECFSLLFFVVNFVSSFSGSLPCDPHSMMHKINSSFIFG